MRLHTWTQVRDCSECGKYRTRRVNSHTHAGEPFVCAMCQRESDGRTTMAAESPQAETAS